MRFYINPKSYFRALARHIPCKRANIPGSIVLCLSVDKIRHALSRNTGTEHREGVWCDVCGAVRPSKCLQIPKLAKNQHNLHVCRIGSTAGRSGPSAGRGCRLDLNQSGHTATTL